MNDKQEEPPESDKQLQTSTHRQELIGLLANGFIEKGFAKAQEPLQQVLQNLPNDPATVRTLPFYTTTLRAIQYQRDAYLVGPDYAEERRHEKEDYLAPPPVLGQMPYDATALGSMQIANLGSWFLPSATVKEALLPIVVSLPSGALKETIVLGVVNAIPLAQPIVDQAVKSSVLDFIQNPYWREVIKNRTKGFIGRRENNDSNKGHELSGSTSEE
jgi:hypothetical protein